MSESPASPDLLESSGEHPGRRGKSRRFPVLPLALLAAGGIALGAVALTAPADTAGKWWQAARTFALEQYGRFHEGDAAPGSLAAVIDAEEDTPLPVAGDPVEEGGPRLAAAGAVDVRSPVPVAEAPAGAGVTAPAGETTAGEPPAAGPTPGEGRLAELEATVRGLESLGTRMAALEGLAARVEALARRMDALEAGAREAGEGRAEEHTAALAAGLEALRQQVAALDGRLAGTSRLARQNRLASKKLVREPGPEVRNSPPFVAVAVDWWDGQPNLVVRAQGETRFLGVGEAVDGWRLASIDADNRSAVFMSPAQGRTVVEVQQ